MSLSPKQFGRAQPPTPPCLHRPGAAPARLYPGISPQRAQRGLRPQPKEPGAGNQEPGCFAGATVKRSDPRAVGRIAQLEGDWVGTRMNGEAISGALLHSTLKPCLRVAPWRGASSLVCPQLAAGGRLCRESPQAAIDRRSQGSSRGAQILRGSSAEPAEVLFLQYLACELAATRN